MRRINHEIMIAVLTGEASEEDERHLAEWRAADPTNDMEYRRLAHFWAASEKLLAGMKQASVTAPTAREIVAIAEHRSRIRAAESPSYWRLGGRLLGARSRWQPAALAAAVVGGLALGLGILLSELGRDTSFGPSALVTGVDEVATVTLKDETIVRLAPGSRLEFSQDGPAREVFLEGRAYFAVASPSNQPFRVRLRQGEVEVLGTRFDVWGHDSNIQVAVVEGEVRMSAADGASVDVRPNQVARATERGVPEVEEVENAFQVIDWLGRFLVFNATPMGQVADEFRIRFGVRIEISDAHLLRRTVTGWFSDQSPEEMIANICTAVSASCVVRDGAVVMEPWFAGEKGAEAR